MKGISCIIFDFDGTLADTATEIVATMTGTFQAMGRPVPPENDMRQTIGMALRIALRQLGNLSEEETVEATNCYTKLFMERGVNRVALFPGVAETLAAIKAAGIRMAIATSRNMPSLETILRNNGVFDCFEAFVTNSDNLAPKPSPEMVLALHERMGVTAEETLVVGDTTFDIEMGNRAGCRTVAVTYGNHSRELLESVHPSVIADSLSELIDILSE